MLLLIERIDLALTETIELAIGERIRTPRERLKLGSRYRHQLDRSDRQQLFIREGIQL